MEVQKLDNPTWYSLTETHQDFAIDYKGVRFYQSSYCPFGGFIDAGRTEVAIDTYSLSTNSFYVVGNKPSFSNNVQLNNELVCNQMLLDQRIEFEACERIIELQTPNHKTDLFNLINLAQPGYFRSKTSDLGNYYGVYENDQLIAVTGERMKMNGYIEVNAVVTHPEHTGKGYAKQLISHTCQKIFDEDKIPYLHVAHTNLVAIKLYEKLGFKIRRKISLWNLHKKKAE